MIKQTCLKQRDKPPPKLYLVLTALPMVIYFFLVLLLEAMVMLATDREVCSLEINK